jgi:DNA-binding GntR family transcriptional regulator
VLAEAADNEFLADTLNRMSHLIQWVYSSRIQERSDRSWREHRQIVQAIADQDADAAYSCAFTHVVNARNAYLAAPSNGSLGG